MEKLVKCILWIITIICIYAILHIGLGWFCAIGVSDNYLKINQVLINLSYSYIAGVIFYLLTVFFPYKYRLQKLKRPINSKIKDIHGKIIDSAKSFFPMTSWDNLVLSEDNLKQQMITVSIHSQTSYSIAGIKRTIISHLFSQRGDIMNLIKELL